MGRGGVRVVREYTFDASLRSLRLRLYSFCACAYLMRYAGILIRVFISLLYIAVELLDLMYTMSLLSLRYMYVSQLQSVALHSRR